MLSTSDVTFGHVAERDVTRAIARQYAAQFDDYVESDVLIAGGGPSGLLCAKVLAERGAKVLIVERNNYLGGGFWIGGYLMNKAVFRAPSQEILDDLGVPYVEASDGIFVADAPHACAKLIGAACDAGAKIQNMTFAEDIVVREDTRVAGLVINWTPVQSLPRQITCVDPVALEAKVVIDATGHDAALVARLQAQGLAEVQGCGPMWVERSEDAVVAHTGVVHPGLIAIGMAVSAVHGLPRMGPSFGSMLLSGLRGAECALECLEGVQAVTAGVAS
jgi:thiazole biosynthesis enzyme